jgi:DNA-directed RNA polymerase subunit RPC12/RpoP
MECPNCHQDLKAPEGEEINLVDCQACGSQSMPEAKYCHQCGKALAGDEEAADNFCPHCSETVKEADNYCASCGQSLSDGPQTADEEEGQSTPGTSAPKKRKACSDGMCIGIIGADGKCTECGKPYEESIE